MTRFYTLVASAAILATFNQNALAGEEEIARFNREYPAAARILAARYSRLRGTCTVSRKSPRGPNFVDRCSFACDGGARKVEISRSLIANGPSIGGFVHCVGDTSSFRLMRLPEMDYQVQGIGGDRFDRAAFDSLFGRYLAAPFLEFDFSLLKLMSLPKFRIISAQYVEHEGRTLMQVECELGDPTSADKRKLLLDPESDWVIHRVETRFGMYREMLQVCEIEYSPREAGPQLPKQVRFEIVNMEDATCTFESMSMEPTPESQFRMSAYGLPDLASSVPRRPHSYFGYWAGGIAVAGLLLAILIGALARRGRVVRA